MRTALLPAGGDPFLLTYWLRHYEQLWADEVDDLRIVVCGQDYPDVREYIQAKVAAVPHASVSFAPRMDHGTLLRQMLGDVHKHPNDRTGNLVMFCEDDAFVRHPGVVGSRFQRLLFGDYSKVAPGPLGPENWPTGVDVVGTARGNASPNLIARAEELFGPLPQTATGETGLSLYPCFLFTDKANLDGLDFQGQAWYAGDYIPPLDYTCSEYEGCDTFTLASWYLRQRGLQIDAEAAYRSDSAHAGSGRMNVDGGTNRGDAPWFHVGSLSSGYGGSFMANMGPENYAKLVAQISPKQELYDWHKRMSWWTRVADCTEGELPEFHATYRAALDRFMADVGADPAEVARWRANYDPLVTWREA